MPKILILIDIDGTLLYPGMTPRHALSAAIRQYTGKTIEFTVPMLAGMTDPLIVRNALDFLGVGDNIRDNLPERILETYLEILADHYPRAKDPRLYPGARTLLRLLQDMPVRLGLITGNLERGAMIKLQPFGLAEYFSMGVFGSDHSDRDRLPLIALEKCHERFRENYSPKQVVIIGDSVRDVLCAHRNGMRAIAVVRHKDRLASITAENPDLIVSGFIKLDPVKNYLVTLIG